MQSVVWVLYDYLKLKNNKKFRNEDDGFFDLTPAFGSKLAQKLTVIGRFRCSKSTFYRSKLETNKNNNS